jgi:hypothetical protein
MLPAVIPNARIMSWGYDANTHSTTQLSAMYLYDHAQKLVSDLSLYRRMDKVDNSTCLFNTMTGNRFCRQIHDLLYSLRTV